MKRIGLFAAGLLCGALLFGGAGAYAAGLFAEPSTHSVYVDGKEVQVEAYLIEGHNYFKLRDIGEQVGFNVYWDGDGKTVQIETDKAYSGVCPETVEARSSITEEVNEAIFRNGFSREAYEALRHTVVTGQSVRGVPGNEESYSAMLEAAAAIGEWPIYQVYACEDGLSYCAEYPENYREAAAYCMPFIEDLSGLSVREQVRQMAFFVCDRLTYKSGTYCSPRTSLISEEVSPGACMSYAHDFKFLCDLAGIPCILTHSETHQWNQVYVEGEWWHVDVTATDAGDEKRIRPYQTILWAEDSMQGVDYQQTNLWLVQLAKEILVPGSTD